jgi:alpha-tubulin suppressor-like RCC1 family protein
MGLSGVSWARCCGLPRILAVLADAALLVIAGGVASTSGAVHSGPVFAWGDNPFGELGNGTTATSATPVQVSGISNATQVAAGGIHSVARLSDGTIRAWGDNRDGELGNGTTTNSSTPVQVSGISNATQVAAGGEHSLALLSDGTIRAWGYNVAGQLGNRTTTNSSTPVQVSDISNATQVAAGGAHSLALLSDGTVGAWGSDCYGQLGIGFTIDSATTPMHVPGISNATQVAAGGAHSLALLSDGTVRAWGSNSSGQLGNGTTTDSATPVQVSGISNATQVAGGEYQSLALLSDGTIRAWGYNAVGQLGNGTTTDSSTPVQVSGLSKVVAITAGKYASYALESDGTVWAWGYNHDGQLGNGTTTGSSTPVQVANLGTATVSLGSGPAADHALAVVVARASAAPASLDFGHQTVGGKTAAQAVTLTNEGPLLQVTGVSFVGLDADSFTLSYDGCSGKTLAASESCMIGVRFYPQAVGGAGATLMIADNEPSGGRSVPMTGTGDPALVALAPPPIAPQLTRVSQSAKRWRLGKQLPHYASARTPIGTTFRFTLDKRVQVTFAFTQTVGGRRVGGKCVPVTKQNSNKPRCERTITSAMLRHTGHIGKNSLHFEGRINRRRWLAPGTYTLKITATDRGKQSKPAFVRFTILPAVTPTAGNG